MRDKPETSRIFFSDPPSSLSQTFFRLISRKQYGLIDAENIKLLMILNSIISFWFLASILNFFKYAMQTYDSKYFFNSVKKYKNRRV